MNIVYVASEAVPFAKTGGLADVAGALPRALESLGHSVSVFLPCHRRVWQAKPELVGSGVDIQVHVGSRRLDAHVHETGLPGSDVSVYLVDRPAYFDRAELYQEGGKDYADNCERFAFFNRAVLEAISLLGLRPDIIHCNDWQTGLIPAYLRTLYRGVTGLAKAGTLMTIHNLAYPGLFRPADMALLGLDGSLFNPKGLEFHGRLSFMKAGLVFADMLSTVSPTYAQEIQTPELGCGLDGLLRERRADLRGIVNGIDTQEWSPAHEPMLACCYDVSTFREGKACCKAWLQGRAGFPLRRETPLFAQIGRLDHQKGWYLLSKIADRLLAEDVQLVVLGTGHPTYHQMLSELARRHRERLFVHLGFSDELAHQIEAGADVFLMPSLFEPCGLNQLYSLAHGTVPLVRATGGLADTVVNLDPWTLGEGIANGFVFREPTAGALWRAIEVALVTWPQRSIWEQLIRNGMESDWSWNRSASDYAALYAEIIRRIHPLAA
ncbi:MAG: glycogen synthase GlgA [Isosphaeraceae bacterium]